MSDYVPANGGTHNRGLTADAITTPTSRIIYVMPESRIVNVQPETRTIAVKGEARVVTVSK